MKLLVAGTREDVAGFALAGVDGVVCATREDVEQAVTRADEDTLLIVSYGMADDGWQMAGDGRLVVVLPPSAIGHLPARS